MLNKLPDEIVVNIVEHCSEPRPFARASLFAPPPHDSNPYEALKWSHLSKHHRALMRSTASLWTWISSDMHPALIQECLQLSSDLALDVEISAKHTETDSLQALLHPPSSTRWSSLLMRIPIIQNGRPGFAVTPFKDWVRNFFVDLKGLQLPNLSRLCLIHEQEIYEVYAYDGHRPISWFETMHDTWSAPHIREIVTNGGDSLSLQFRNTITKFTFTLDTLAHIEDFGRLISTFGFVRELCVRWSTNRGGITANPGDKRTPWRMPSVSVLRLELETGVPHIPWVADSVDILLTSILFPNLTTLQIQITTFDVQHNATHTPTSKDLLDALLYGRPPGHTFRFPSISAFEFRIDGNPCLPSDWMLPVHEFRALQHLTLKGMSMELFPSEDGKHLDYYTSRRPPPTLQSITLEDCDRITTEGLASFLEALQETQDEGGRKNQRERVTVVRCKCVDVLELGTSLKSTDFFWVSE